MKGFEREWKVGRETVGNTLVDDIETCRSCKKSIIISFPIENCRFEA